jgi:hypothetical protein
MQIRKILQRRIRKSTGGVDLVGDVNAAIAANVGERSQTTHVSSRSTVASTTAPEPKEEDGRDEPDSQPDS